MTDDLDAILPPETERAPARVSEPMPLSTLLSRRPESRLRAVRTWPPDEPVGPWIAFGAREARQEKTRAMFPRGGWVEPVFQPAHYLDFYRYTRSYLVEHGTRISARQASLTLFHECPVCGGCGYVRGKSADTRRVCPRWSSTTKTCEAPSSSSTYTPMMAWLMIIALMFARAKGIA